MDPFLAASLASAGANLLGGMAAGEAQEAAANKAYAAQKEALIKMQDMLQEIGIPPLEAQKLVLERPEYAGDLITETLGPSAMQEIEEDPRLKAAQMDALAELQEIGEVGLTPEERAQRSEMLRQSAAQGQATQKQILQQMAQRGTLDSGASLIAQLQANAEETSDARRQSEQLAADVAQRRRDAIMQAANVAGNMSSTDINRQTQAAQAADRIAQFNLQNRATAQERNLDRQQSYANMLADMANKEQQYNKQLLQQQYEQKMDRARLIGGVGQQQAQAAANYATQMGAAQAGKAAGMGSTIGNIATAAGSYYGNKAAAADQRAHDLKLAKIKSGKV